VSAPTFASLATPEDVLAQFDVVLDWAKAAPSRVGYFAAMHRRVTSALMAAIDGGDFDDGPRMERMIVEFGTRYFEALRAWLGGGATVPASWKVAFDSTHRARMIVLEHLLVGMNAHIRFDLPVTTATVVPEAQLPSFRADFEKVNVVLDKLVDRDRLGVDHVSPMIRHIDVLGRRTDDIIDAALGGARELAWAVAGRLARLSGNERTAMVDALDESVAKEGRSVVRPDCLFAAVSTFVVYPAEVHDVAAVIRALE
jgi:hypothetical protein